MLVLVDDTFCRGIKFMIVSRGRNFKVSSLSGIMLFTNTIVAKH